MSRTPKGYRKGKKKIVCESKKKKKLTQNHSNGEMERFLIPEQTGNVWRPNTIKLALFGYQTFYR